jgi:hypothetical protein
VPVEGVVDALRKLHGGLSPGARLVDTQPISPRPAVAARGGRLGTLDMREWARTIRAVDDQMIRANAGGLFELEEERTFVVTDTFDDGPECAETVGSWAGTRLAPSLAAKIRAAVPPLTVDQEVRLRVFVRAG